MATQFGICTSRLFGVLALTAILAACDDKSSSALAPPASLTADAGSTGTTNTPGTAKGAPGTITGSTSTGSTVSENPTATVTDSVTLAWAAPSENTNGSALTNLAGFMIFYGNSATALTKQITISTAGELNYVVQNLETGTWYFEVVAINSAGVQSVPSTVVSVTI